MVAGRLQDAHENGGTWLDLRGCGLTEIPEEAYRLTQLEAIDLSDNQLTHLPECIWDLPNLKRLYFYENPIQTLPNRKGLFIDLPIYLNCREQINPSHIELWIGDDIWPEHPLPFWRKTTHF